jgi:hypothetical protein
MGQWKHKYLQIPAKEEEEEEEGGGETLITYSNTTPWP